MKLARQKQEFVNSAPKTPFRRDLTDFVRDGMFFSTHPEWVSIWKSAPGTTGNIRTCISLRTFRQVNVRNPFSPLNIQMFLQQVVESQLRPFLDSLRIKVEGENVHKTTFIANCDTMPYKCWLFSLLDIGIAFKKIMHMTLGELVSLHLYLDDLIVCIKGLIMMSGFQVLGPL